MEPRQPPQQQDHQDYHYVDYEAEDSPAQLHIDTITNVPTPLEQQQRFTLTSDEVLLLTDDALEIESIYACTMDIEFAKDGLDNQIYVLQARPETVSSGRRDLVASGRAMELPRQAKAPWGGGESPRIFQDSASSPFHQRGRA